MRNHNHTALLLTYIFHFQPLIHSEYLHSPIQIRRSPEASTLPEGTTDTFLTAQCDLSNSVYGQIEDCSNHVISFHSSDSKVRIDKEGSENGLAQSCGDAQWLLNGQFNGW